MNKKVKKYDEPMVREPSRKASCVFGHSSVDVRVDCVGDDDNDDDDAESDDADDNNNGAEDTHSS